MTSGAGNLSFGPAGNLLIGSWEGVLYQVSRATGEISTLAITGDPEALNNSVYDSSAGRIYVGTAFFLNTNKIYSVDPTNGESSVLIDVSGFGYTQQLLLAPAGFGSFGGKLLMLTYGVATSGLHAIDPENPGPPTTVSDHPGTDMDFAPDGTLYVTDYDNDQVVSVSASGQIAHFVTISNPEGIAVNAAGNLMFVASTGTVTQIYRVTIPDAVATVEASPVLQRGTSPTGLVLDGSGKLLHRRGESELLIDAIDITGNVSSR